MAFSMRTCSSFLRPRGHSDRASPEREHSAAIRRLVPAIAPLLVGDLTEQHAHDPSPPRRQTCCTSAGDTATVAPPPVSGLAASIVLSFQRILEATCERERRGPDGDTHLGVVGLGGVEEDAAGDGGGGADAGDDDPGRLGVVDGNAAWACANRAGTCRSPKLDRGPRAIGIGARRPWPSATPRQPGTAFVPGEQIHWAVRARWMRGRDVRRRTKSPRLVRGQGRRRWRTASCWRRARLSMARLARERKADPTAAMKVRTNASTRRSFAPGLRDGNPPNSPRSFADLVLAKDSPGRRPAIRFRVVAETPTRAATATGT